MNNSPISLALQKNTNQIFKIKSYEKIEEIWEKIDGGCPTNILFTLYFTFISTPFSQAIQELNIRICQHSSITHNSNVPFYVTLDYSIIICWN